MDQKIDRRDERYRGCGIFDVEEYSILESSNQVSLSVSTSVGERRKGERRWEERDLEEQWYMMDDSLYRSCI